MPSAIALITENWACISVGNSGKGAVVISTGFGLSLDISREIEFSSVLTIAPASLSLSITFLSLSAFIPFTVIFPFVTAAAARYVPASILSAGMLCSVPESLLTPSITILSDPAPSIFAPISFKNSAKSIISGSLATFVNSVIPSAKQAAIIIFSVPVTVTPSNLIFAPTNFFALASI